MRAADAVAEPAQLTNSGGFTTLLNAAGLKVSGVAYTETDARREGWTLTFERDQQFIRP